MQTITEFDYFFLFIDSVTITKKKKKKERKIKRNELKPMELQLKPSLSQSTCYRCNKVEEKVIVGKRYIMTVFSWFLMASSFSYFLSEEQKTQNQFKIRFSFLLSILRIFFFVTLPLPSLSYNLRYLVWHFPFFLYLLFFLLLTQRHYFPAIYEEGYSLCINHIAHDPLKLELHKRNWGSLYIHSLFCGYTNTHYYEHTT